jgi:uncharacterized damage-inducible protein DinB
LTQSVLSQLHAVNRVLSVNLDGVTHDESLQQPSPAGNCLNWILGHLVASYDNLLKVLDAERVLTPEQFEVYDRAAEPLTESTKAMSFDDLREAFGTSHERVVAAIENLPAERLDDPSPFSPGKNPNETIGSLLSLFAFHQAYHAGQTGLGRRLVGKPNAIT